MPELRTGREWDRLLKSQIMDPDGWDRTGSGGPDFDTTKISLKEFVQRSMSSTTAGRSSEYNELVRLFRDIHKVGDAR